MNMGDEKRGHSCYVSLASFPFPYCYFSFFALATPLHHLFVVTSTVASGRQNSVANENA